MPRPRLSAVCLLALLAVCPRDARALTFTVSTTADTPDDDALDGLCLDASGECSLRAAITEANRTAESDDVAFAIPGGEPWTIDLVTPLPPITTRLTISTIGYRVVIRTTHGVATGLELAPGSDGSAISSIVLGGFANAIKVRSNGCAIASNRIGTDADGSTAIPNSVAGIWDEGAGTQIYVNLICASNVALVLRGSGTGVWGGNVMGVCNGTTLLPNVLGVLMEGTTGLQSSNSYGPNSIIGTPGDGVRITGAATGNMLHGWSIQQSGGAGIRFEDTANDNTVSGVQINANIGAGIAVEAGSRNNRFSDFVIHGNGGLGIDLLGPGNTPGVTPNDADDTDTGANDRQNFPAGRAGSGASTIRVLSGGTIIQGGLKSRPNQGYTLEFYQSPSCDPSGFGEGQEEIATSSTVGCTQITTDATGYANIGCQLTTPIKTGWVVAALATGEAGTSEFSECTSLTTTTTTSNTTSTSTSTSTTTTRPTTSTTTTMTTSTLATSTSTSTSTSTTTTSTTTTHTASTTRPTTTTTTTTSTTTTTRTATTAPPTSTTTLTTTTTTSTTTTSASTTTSRPSTTTTTAAPPTTTSTTITTTTTTTPPSTNVIPACGNGALEADEQCDPAVPGSRGCCNAVSCLPYAAGTSCGLERDPCGAPVCDGGGSCVTRPVFVGIRCRESGSIGPCDPGSVCGSAPYCPSDDTASGCEALDFALAPNATRMKFRCEAHTSPRGSVKCAADLVASSTLAPRARRRGAKLVAAPASDCVGPQFDTTLPKKLARTSRGALSRVIVARINKVDRGYFAPGKTICVRVRFTTGSAYSQTRLYNVTVPVAP